MKSLKLLTVLSAVLIPSAVYAECLIWTSWKGTTLSTANCLNRAQTVVTNAGFRDNFYRLESAVYAKTGEYSATIRCISSKGVAFFIVAGPDATTAKTFLGKLENSF